MVASKGSWRLLEGESNLAVVRFALPTIFIFKLHKKGHLAEVTLRRVRESTRVLSNPSLLLEVNV